MYKYILEQAGDINLLAIVPLIIFVVFFVGVSLRAIYHDKKFVHRMAQMPLDDGHEDF